MIVVIISENFAKSNQGYKVGSNTFDYSQLKTGEYICAINSVNDFPELFDNIQVSLKNITSDDFKQIEQNG